MPKPPKPKCRCKGSSGNKKRLYLTRQRAVTVAIGRGWSPSTYHCPTSRGFHLTHGLE